MEIHWLDESRFLLHLTDGRTVWRQPNTASNIQETIPFGGGSVMVWGCVSHDCKLDLITVQGNLNGPRCKGDILEIVVVLHFNKHALATKPVFMDDNARPHRTRAVMNFLQRNVITNLPWPTQNSLPQSK